MTAPDAWSAEDAAHARSGHFNAHDGNGWQRASAVFAEVPCAWRPGQPMGPPSVEAATHRDNGALAEQKAHRDAMLAEYAAVLTADMASIENVLASAARWANSNRQQQARG